MESSKRSGRQVKIAGRYAGFAAQDAKTSYLEPNGNYNSKIVNGLVKMAGRHAGFAARDAKTPAWNPMDMNS